MFLGIFDGFLESSLLAEGDIEEFDPVFLGVLMPHLEEFLEIFLGTRIEARSVDGDMKSLSELGGDHHTHIITIRTLLSSFGCMLNSLDTSEEVGHVIRSLDIRNFLDRTDLHERFVSFIVF